MKALIVDMQARELASGSGSRVNKDPNSLLRYGLPAQPKGLREVRAMLFSVDVWTSILEHPFSFVSKPNTELEGSYQSACRDEQHE